jgi:hypothetical protein
MDINEEETQNLSTIDSMYVDEYDIFRSMNSEIDKHYTNEISKKSIKQNSKKIPEKLPEKIPEKLPEIIEDVEDLNQDEN